MNIKTASILYCEVLVAGSGLAGLRAAKDLNDKGIKTILLSRGPLCSGSSFYPLTAALGSQNPASEEDKKDYLEEVLTTGCTVADEKLVKMIIDRIPGEIGRLSDLSIEPKRLYAGRPACFAKKERLLYSWGGWDRIREGVKKTFAALPHVRVMEYADLLYLHKEDGKIVGALIADADGSVHFVRTGAVILATGGTCGLYKHSLNVNETVGSGHSAALAAGAELINMEFLQFIPGFTKPVYKLLFSETTLRRAVSVKNADGEDALSDYIKAHGNGDTLSECLWDRALHGPFTTEDASKYFDLSLMEDARKNHRECGFEIRFDPAIKADDNGFIVKAREMYEPYGIDLSKDPIWLSSFAHCANGGIRVNEKAETNVPGLYAAGEAAGGIHGADRHGGMATSAALVFGAIAAKSAAEYVKKTACPADCREATGQPCLTTAAQQDPAKAALAEFSAFLAAGSGKPASMAGNMPAQASAETGKDVSPQEVLTRLAKSLWYNANALRSEESLSETLALVETLSRTYDAGKVIEEGGDLREAVKAFHALRAARAMVMAMLCRRESRGPHFRSDCPEKDAAMDGKRIVITENGCQVI